MAEFKGLVDTQWDGPHMGINFPDPTIIKDGSTWKAYATSSNNKHIPVAESSDAVSWKFTGRDALPEVGSWVDPKDRGIWAPDVFKNDAGEFVMYCTYTGTSSFCPLLWSTWEVLTWRLLTYECARFGQTDRWRSLYWRCHFINLDRSFHTSGQTAHLRSKERRLYRPQRI